MLQDAKLADKMQFPESFATKVDMKKVKYQFIQPWIVQQVTLYMKTEDDVLTGMIDNLLEKERVWRVWCVFCKSVSLD